jgi:hypothetical protein
MLSTDDMRISHWKRCCETLGLTKDHPNIKGLEMLFLNAALSGFKGTKMDDATKDIPLELQEIYQVVLAGHRLGEALCERLAKLELVNRLMMGA